MSSPEVQRLQETVVFLSVAGRQVNTRNGQKTVWDCKTQDGRTFQTWDQPLALQAQNLVGQQVQVVYKEKPSRDPQYPPNLELETITPMGLPGSGAAAASMAPMAAPTAAAPQMAPLQQVGSPAGGLASPAAGPMTEHDKDCMRRSAAVKAAAYAWAADPETQDFWILVDQILVFIETGNDPVPFSGGEQQQQAADPASGQGYQ